MSDGPIAGLSLVFQQLDNRGTIIEVDPEVRNRFPEENDAELRYRIKIESAYVKLYGTPIEKGRSLLRWLGGPSEPFPMVITDGDAFIVEFQIDQRDIANRRSSMLFFGYLPIDPGPTTVNHVRARLDLLGGQIGLDWESVHMATRALEAAIPHLSKVSATPSRRPIFSRRSVSSPGSADSILDQQHPSTRDSAPPAPAERRTQQSEADNGHADGAVQPLPDADRSSSAMTANSVGNSRYSREDRDQVDNELGESSECEVQQGDSQAGANSGGAPPNDQG